MVLVRDVLPKNQKVITIQSTDTVESALNTLDRWGITSAPVLDPNGKIEGFLDVVDLVCYMLKIVSKSQHSNTTPDSTSLATDDMEILSRRSAEFSLTKVVDAVDLSLRNPYFPVRGDQPISDVVAIFLRGPHRVAVTDIDNKIQGILTQSNLIAWLAEDPSRVPDFKANMKIGSMAISSLVSVTPSTLTVDAFNLLLTQNVSSVAIVDPVSGQLTGSLSASDLKSIKSYRFMKLLAPVSEFVVDVRLRQGKAPNYIVTASKSTQLSAALKRMVHERVHRLFVVDDAERPIGVLCMSDILREVYVQEK